MTPTHPPPPRGPGGLGPGQGVARAGATSTLYEYQALNNQRVADLGPVVAGRGLELQREMQRPDRGSLSWWPGARWARALLPIDMYEQGQTRKAPKNRPRPLLGPAWQRALPGGRRCASAHAGTVNAGSAAKACHLLVFQPFLQDFFGYIETNAPGGRFWF